MGWLVGYTVASMVGAILVVRLFDYLLSSVASGFVNVAKGGVFVATWTAITAGSGMRDFTSRIRRLRQLSGKVGDWVDAPLKDRRNP